LLFFHRNRIAARRAFIADERSANLLSQCLRLAHQDWSDGFDLGLSQPVCRADNRNDAGEFTGAS
jgi:hypothetical protein